MILLLLTEHFLLYQVHGIASCNMLVVIISLVISYYYRSRGFHLVPTFSEEDGG
jgi:hypothetical protein